MAGKAGFPVISWGAPQQQWWKCTTGRQPTKPTKKAELRTKAEQIWRVWYPKLTEMEEKFSFRAVQEVLYV